MPKLAHDIVVDHENKHISIDGQVFPWYIPLEDLSVTISPDGMHRIDLALYFDGSFRSWGKAPK